MKVRIKTVPKKYKSGGQNSFNELQYQNLTNNPSAYKSGKVKPLYMEDEEKIGHSYPEEEKGEGNIEAEGGEWIAKVSDGNKLFKIKGKDHKDGGTSIKAEGGDFIFSKSEKIKGEILKTEFGLNPNKEYSFADIVAKYKKMNDFQRLAQSENPFEKKTGEMMIANLNEKLAKIAFLQEVQKGLPNGLPQIAMPLIDQAAKIPTEAIPKDSPMAKYGMEYGVGGDVQDPNKKPTFKDYYDKKSKKQYVVPEEMKYSDPEMFYTKEVLDFMSSRDKEEGIDSDLGNAKDYTWGKRHQEAYEKFFKGKIPTPESTAAVEKNTEGIAKVKTENEIELNIPNVDLSGKSVSSGYKDLGYSTPENLAMLNALRPIRYIGPTRFQNYGLTQAMGIMSNVNPFNYQSLINESSRAGYNAIKANRVLSRNSASAFANNFGIAGSLAENTSKIKGEEYNQNANLYNTTLGSMANYAEKIGLDKMNNAINYNAQVIQGRENLEANKWQRNKEFIQEFSNASNNRSLRNAFAYLGASTNPNFPILNADMAIGFSPSLNPFSLNTNSTRSGDISTDYAAFRKQLPKEVLDKMEEKDIFKYFMDDYRKTYKQ